MHLDNSIIELELHENRIEEISSLNSSFPKKERKKNILPKNGQKTFKEKNRRKNKICEDEKETELRLRNRKKERRKRRRKKA